MIDKEMVDLEKIKRKQQLDIEKMLGQEMNRKSIEMRNAEKAQLEQQRQLQIKQVALRRAEEAAEKAQEQEQKRRRIAEREALLQAQRKSEADLKD